MVIYYRSSDKFSFISKVTNGPAVIQEDEVSTVTSTSVASNELDGEQLPLFSSNIESLPLPSEMICTGLEEGSIMGTNEEVNLATLLGLEDSDAEDEEVQHLIATDTEAVLGISSGRVAPLTGRKSSRKSTAKKAKQVASTKISIPSDAERNKGRAARRVKVGATDIFSDDDDDEYDQQVKGTSASMKGVGSSRKRERAQLVVVSNDSEIGVDAQVSFCNEDTGLVAGAIDGSDVLLGEPIESYPKKQRSTLRKTAVTFSLAEIDHVTDTLDSTCLESGSRRSRRMSGAGSAKKTQAKRKGTPRALPSDRPRFSRPSQYENDGAMETEDEERRTSGYGSYFSTIQQVPRCSDQQ
jgi:hypothetical protein